MRELFIDIETFSLVNLVKSGVYPYVDHDDFELLLFGFSIDGDPVEVVDLTNGDQLPDTVLAALVDPHVGKWAFNAAFERICLSSWLTRQYPELMVGRRFLDPAQWRCTMVWSAYLGLPMSLEQVATVLDLPVRKDSAGKKLIRQFCIPATPSVFNQAGMRNPPASDPDGWGQFISYNRRDVEVELAIHDRLADFPLPVSEWDTYALDQRVNDTGIRLDQALVDNAVACDRQHRATTLARAQELTGLENPNSPIQLKDWLADHGTPLQSVTKDEVSAALDTATGQVREVLQLRGELAKSSVKKHEAMQDGAGRTGRFADRLVQVQNLPRNHLPDLAQAHSLVRAGDFDAVELLYDSVPDTLSQLIRTAFIPADGRRFVVADFSAIEARVIAWLAEETTTLRAFEEGKDPYCETASRMFGVPIDKHGANAELRQKGKIRALACCYQDGVGALKAMGALRMGLAESELQPLVDAWQAANSSVVQLWADINAATIETISTSQPTSVGALTFTVESGIMFIHLPSGRSLAYVKPKLGENRFGGTNITHEGTMTGRKWSQLETYGEKLTKNILQAVARDLLTFNMHRVDRAGHRIVMHVHDEIIVETATATVDEIRKLMATAPNWAQGLPLAADGYSCDFYQKD